MKEVEKLIIKNMKSKVTNIHNNLSSDPNMSNTKKNKLLLFLNNV